jgi:hypothetical protein
MDESRFHVSSSFISSVKSRIPLAVVLREETVPETQDAEWWQKKPWTNAFQAKRLMNCEVHKFY